MVYDEKHPSSKAFVSKIKGTLNGEVLAENRRFDVFLKDYCDGPGYQTQAIAVPYARKNINFVSNLVVDTDDMMNSGNPKWLEVRADDDPNILVCCQFTRD